MHLSHRERSICAANRVRGYGLSMVLSPSPARKLATSPYGRGKGTIEPQPRLSRQSLKRGIAAARTAISREPVMRSFVSPFAASAVLAMAILGSSGAQAQAQVQTVAEPVICAPLSVAAPALLIQTCTALIENAATPEAERLDATITRAVALHNSCQTHKALTEIAAVIARDPERARAFRARGEIMRQLGKTEAAFEALNRAIRLEPENANAL